MAENVVGIDIVARLDAFRSELAKIPDIGGQEAKALTAQLSKEIKAAEKAARDAAKASKDAAKGMSDAGKQAKRTAEEIDHAAKAMEEAGEAAGTAGSSAAKLAGALDLVAPGAGAAALAVADLADVGEVAAGAASALGVSLGTLVGIVAPIALLVAGVSLAWSEYSAAAEEAAEFQERLNAALDGVDGIASATRAEISKLKLNLGQLTEAQYEDEEIRRRWADSLEGGTAQLREEQEALESQMAAIGRATGEYLKLQDRLHEVNGLLETATNLNAAGEEAALANAAIARERGESEEFLAERLRQKNEAEQRSAEAAAKAAEATRKADEAARAYSEQLHAEEAAGASQRARYDAAVAKLGELAEADLTAALTAEERADAEHATALQRIENLRNEALAAAETATARENVEAEANAAILAEDERYYAARDKARQADAQKTQDAAVATAASVVGAVQAVADAVGDIAEEGTEQQKRLALVAFRVSQAAAIASTVITTAAAAMKAYSAALELGPPGLILAPIAAGAAAATGAAQVATIAAQDPPKFHAGLAPDEVPATLTRGEGVLTPRGVEAAGGAEGIRRMNRGEGAADRPIVVVQQVRHKVLDAAVADNLRLPTSPLRRAVRAGRRVGHRRREA